MSIYGIGVDIVELARIQSSQKEFGERFAQRILHPNEQKALEALSDPQQITAFLAKRFAAKEATAKALGTGFRDGIAFKDIEVRHDKLGKPLLYFYGKTNLWVLQQEIGKSHISLSDEHSHVVAFVVLEQGYEGG